MWDANDSSILEPAAKRLYMIKKCRPSTWAPDVWSPRQSGEDASFQFRAMLSRIVEEKIAK